ncbi:MAG: TolC family protein [Lentimicrobiaceae bacterium]|nr:TolC family protein [Lentimicrobiaceae bacterium]
MRPFLLLLTGLISQQINGTTSRQAESLSYNDTVSQSSTATSQDLTANIDFRTAVRLMLENNNAIKAAEKNTELARRQSQLINASWFPTITMTGTYAMMSNKISVNQEYAPLLDPLKEKYADDFLVPNVLNFISKELGDLSFDVPVIDDDFGSIDLEVIYPLFTGVKRIYANKLAKDNESLSEITKESIGATKYLELANIYFSLSLNESMIKVLNESHDMTKHHYSQAVKMENIGMFDKAERLIVKVALDESDRNLKSAENQNEVLKNALYTIIGLRDNKSTSQQVGQQVDNTTDNGQNISTSTSLFLNEQYPSLDWFKDMMRKNSYVYKQSELHNDISKNTLRMSRSNYFPVISVFGKQTIASYHVPNNLIPNTVGGINLAWDIFDGLARERNIQMTKIESEIISETQQNLKNELEIAVDEWHANLKQAVVNAKDLQSSLDLAEEVYKIRKKSFAEGLCTSQQVLDALNLLNKTKLLLLTTYFEYDIALANLCCLCGIPEYFEAFINE